MGEFAMSTDPLSYESVPLHPGRFRVAETPDTLEIILVQRPAWDKLPWIVLLWLGLAALGAGLWWLDRHMTVGRPGDVKLILATLSLPVSGVVFSFLLVLQDRQELTLRVDAGGITITRTLLGGPDRQRLAMTDILAIGFDPGSRTVIAFVTPKGTTNVMVARKPVYVREILELVVRRVERFRRADAGGVA